MRGKRKWRRERRRKRTRKTDESKNINTLIPETTRRLCFIPHSLSPNQITFDERFLCLASHHPSILSHCRRRRRKSRNRCRLQKRTPWQVFGRHSCFRCFAYIQSNSILLTTWNIWGVMLHERRLRKLCLLSSDSERSTSYILNRF